jgi:hypothetical protein
MRVALAFDSFDKARALKSCNYLSKRWRENHGIDSLGTFPRNGELATGYESLI